MALPMQTPVLDENAEHRKWPKWLRYVLIAHVGTLFWALFTIPSSGYTLEIGLIVILMWLPLFVFAGYYFERPAIRLSAYRKIYLILAIIAIFLNLIMATAFIE